VTTADSRAAVRDSRPACRAANEPFAPRILIDCGDYHLGNLGDVAMLQVTVARLHELLPNATLGVVTHDPAALAMHCPHAAPVPLAGRDLWIGRGTLLGRADRFLRLVPVLADGGVEAALRRRHTDLFERLMQARLGRGTSHRESFEQFAQALSRADAVVLCGAGGITDHARVWALAVLEIFRRAASNGAATAMFGHGLGPLADPALRRAASQTLPGLDRLALREGRLGPALARELGVSDDRLAVTGDDAIELAYDRRAATLGDAIGVNLRVARSAGVGADFIAPVGDCLRDVAAARGTALLGLPIGRGVASNDTATIRDVLARAASPAHPGADLDSPHLVIDRIGRCRMVVTGAYHAAVFALGQGVPAVCLARSPYFLDKMQGLADQFGAGCIVVDMNGGDFPQRLRKAIDAAWETAPAVRDALLAAGARQIQASRAAYAGFATMMCDRVPTRDISARAGAIRGVDGARAAAHGAPR